MTKPVTLYEFYMVSPEACLDAFFRRYRENTILAGEDMCFIYQSMDGHERDEPQTVIQYGSYKYLRRSQLKGREYRIEFWDDAPSIHWLDVFYCPQVRWPARKAIPVTQFAIPN